MNASPGSGFSWTGSATSSQPINQSWTDLKPGPYAINISWTAGFQNIASGTAGNGITYNGNNLYYHVLGNPADANGVAATFGVQLT